MSRKIVVNKRIKQLQITDKQIAHYCGISVSVLRLWIDAKAVISHEKLLRIAHLLDLEPEELVEIL